MKIVMKESVPGSVDGINTAIYETGAEYDLTETAGARDLAQALVDAGLAEEIGAKLVAPELKPASEAEVVEQSTSDAVEQSARPKPSRSRGKQ